MQERKQPETLRLKAVTPTLTCNDIAASLAWYRDVLGFVARDEMRHEGELVGAVIKAGAVEFMLGRDDFAKGRERKKGVGMRFYCVTGQDVDKLAAAIKKRGGQLDHPPIDQPWGARDFAITDPDGFKITISTGVTEAG